MVIVKPDPPMLYCDESRTLHDRYTVVAGAVASVQDWLDFDGEWRAVLKENGVRYFRMSEFAHSVGPFSQEWKLNENVRQDFFRRLAHIHIYHVALWVGGGV